MDEQKEVSMDALFRDLGRLIWRAIEAARVSQRPIYLHDLGPIGLVTMPNADGALLTVMPPQDDPFEPCSESGRGPTLANMHLHD